MNENKEIWGIFSKTEYRDVTLHNIDVEQNLQTKDVLPV